MNSHSLLRRRIFTIYIFILLLSPIYAIEVNIDGLKYNLKGNSATLVCVAEGNKNSTIEVPSTISYEGLIYTVNTIGNKCFVNAYYSSEKYLHYKNGSYSIGSYMTYVGSRETAIANSYVTIIKLPKSIQAIGASAFSNDNIIKVELQEGVKTISEGTFMFSQIASITLPEGLETIGEYAFARTRIKEIIIPSTVTSISDTSFKECDLLWKLIYLGNKLSSWVATSQTYVPDATWTNPTVSMNDAHIYPMLTWSSSTFSYTGQAPSLTYTNNMEGYSVSMIMPQLHIDAGTWSDEVPVTFTKGDEIINVRIPYQYRIKPAELTAKVQDASRVYGENDPVYEISYSGFVNGEDEEVITTKPTIQSTANSSSRPGEYVVRISSGKATNYTFKYEYGTLTINKAPLLITVNNASREYGDENPTFMYVMEGLKNGEVEPTWSNSGPQLTTDAKQNSSVGIYEINIVNTESPNYEVTTTPGTLTITKAPLTVKVNNASKLYGEFNPDFSYSVQGKKISEEIEWSTDLLYNTLATDVSEVGEYEVTLSGIIDNPNYELATEPGKLTVLKRPLTLSTPNYTRYYGEDNPDFELSYDGFVDGENSNNLTKCPIVTTAATKSSNVGTYKLSISGGEAKNYEFIDKCGTLTVEKAYQTLTWDQEFENVKKYAQLELTAEATSGLEVAYTCVEGQDIANLYTLGNKKYLDVLTEGSIVIMAQQDGNTNYYPSAKIYKTIDVIGKPVTLTLKDGEQGELRENVNCGEVREIAILPAKNYKVHSVTFNDEDVTDQLTADGLFTTPVITSNAALYVVFESLTDGVRSIADISPVRVFARQGEIVVTNLEAGQQIYVYDIDGREQALITSNGLSNSIRLKTEQTYIVKAGTKTVKVRL